MTDARGTGRYGLVVGAVGLALVGLLTRLTTLHAGLAEKSGEEIDASRVTRQFVNVGRGRILDGSPVRNLLAVNVAAWDVCADPKTIVASNCVGEVAAALASVLGLRSADVAAALNQPESRYVRIRPLVPEEQATAVQNLGLPGVFCRQRLRRAYPQGVSLCHVLGFANDEGVGAAGVEQIMERYLRGVPGLLETKVDGNRRELYLQRIRYVPPEDGADVVLTVDQNLQYLVEKALDVAVEQHHARAAWAIMQRVRTGEILAMASRPAYDPNDFRHTSEAQRFNRAIGCLYEPGSTFKVAVIAAALEERLVEPSTVFDCENGQWLYQNRILRDHHPHRVLTVADILKKSSNIGAAKIAVLMGDARLERHLRAFHIGARLGIDLPGEEAGILHPAARWSAISSSRIAIGQGVAVTALQMLGVLSAIANDGMVMRPYVVRQVVDARGRVVLQREPQPLGRAISAETAAVMRQLLARVTEPGGTGTQAAVPGFVVAGKTGTAQKPVNGVYSETDYVASFVGFVPAEDPEIAMIVVVDEPQPFHTGGAVAAPVFGQIAGQAVRYLGILPPAYAMGRTDEP